LDRGERPRFWGETKINARRHPKVGGVPPNGNIREIYKANTKERTNAVGKKKGGRRNTTTLGQRPTNKSPEYKKREPSGSFPPMGGEKKKRKEKNLDPGPTFRVVNCIATREKKEYGFLVLYAGHFGGERKNKGKNAEATKKLV